MMPSDVPSAGALANVIDLVANDNRQDAFGNYVGGWRWRSHEIGAQQAAVSGTYRGGQYVSAIVSHDDDGQLQHNVAVFQQNALQASDPWIGVGRYISTYEAPEALEGVTNSVRSIADHGLGLEWQATELTADYENGGTLSIYVATDVQPSDGSQDPYQLGTEIDYNIELPGAPALPADQDFIAVWLSDGGTIEGTLNGNAGTFSCANIDGCTFSDDHTPGNYIVDDPGVSFTPDGGTAQSVTPRIPGTVPNADYLAIGHWLYVPEDVTDSVNYEFGVYASGGDPFEVTYLAPLAGTATYLGDALGMYYVDGLSDDPTVGSFTADVELTADFGDNSETGFISGEVRNFEFEHDVASSLPATLNLSSDPYSYLSTNFGVPEDSTNIFDTAWSGENAPYPGGFIAAEATASADGQNWYGEWHAAFYGNGLATADIPPSYVEHPTSVAGTFNVSTFDDYKRVDRGLAGSFGAHRYDDGLTRGDPQNLASTIDEVANNSRQEGTVYTSDFWHSNHTGDNDYGAALSHNRRLDGGSHAYASASHDENGQLQFNVAAIQKGPLLSGGPFGSAGPFVLDGRYINTYQNNADLEEVTWFRSPVTDPELAGWHVEELSSSREGGGTLDIFVATDVQTSDGAKDPWVSEKDAEYNISLSGVSARDADKDFIFVAIDDGETIAGSLGDVAGTFSCANTEGCWFVENRYRGPYYTPSTGITFTPDGGSPQTVTRTELLSVTAADYLVFGHWLYVPDDVTDADAYDFGVFASGGDAFQVANLMALAGTASYNGDAAGVYYADGLSSSPNIGNFTADIELTADFKTGSEYGTVSGEVNNFVFDGDANSSSSSLFPAALNLTANAYDGYGVVQGSQNIFDRSWPTVDAPHRGGWISGQIEGGSAEDGSYMSGYWSGKFFGNGAASTDLPTSIGGTLSAYVWDNGQQSERGLAGSFGAHRQ